MGSGYAMNGKFKVDLRTTNDDRRYFYHPHNFNLSSNVIYFDSDLEAVLMKVFKYQHFANIPERNSHRGK